MDFTSCFYSYSSTFSLNSANSTVSKTSAGHFRKPVRKSANCGLKVLVCGFAIRFLTANICGKKIEIYRKSANQQHHWDCFCNFQKNTFFDSMHRQIWVEVSLMYNTFYQDPLLWNDYFPEVLLFLQQNELAQGQETSNGLFL